MWEKLYSKNGLAAKNIAKELIKLDKGMKIPRISDFCEALSFGRGTVQSALTLLEEMKAIKLDARGHLGTFLSGKDDGLLLEIAGIAPLVGSMPLPYSRKYEGLATGIVEVFEQAGERIHLIYMRGGINRIESIRTKRSDFAVVSYLTAEKMLLSYPHLKIIKTLGRESYVSAHKIFLADSQEKGIRNGMKIGVDRASFDQRELTFAEFEGMDVEIVDVNYMQLFDMLHARKIDASIWNMDEKKMVSAFKAIDLQSPTARQMAIDTSIAAIIIDGTVEEIEERWLTIIGDDILHVQENVEKGVLIPHY